MKSVVKVLFLVFIILLIFTCCIALQKGRSAAPATESTAATTQSTSAATTETTVAVTTVPATTAATTTAPTETQLVIPEIHPDTVGIYIPAADGTAARKLVSEFVASRTAKKDIDCFEILATQEALAAGSSFRSIWTDAWNAHENTENAKIGFRIEFALENGELISAQLLKPSDSKDFYDYLEIYMYDDIHQTPGVWYTHLEDKDMKEETIISSIKLTSGSKIAHVGDIALTVFIYTGDDCFDANGEYIGFVSQTILIQEP